ncbi:hypothetical protein GY631_4499 [Trichophyton interdigitale]|nr:hypothetical protein GY631_4499 [Trichophyton interdigitale]KAG5218372.1 hypothetical protein GY632_5607 [Trichophyton interdigitale]
MENITEIEGDLFLAPEGAALIHACNCQGSWGKGIALEFKNRTFLPILRRDYVQLMIPEMEMISKTLYNA